MAPQDEAEAPSAGRRDEYVVIELRGATAHYEPVGDATRTFKTHAASLADELGIEVAELIGCRYSCWVKPDAYGVTRSDFRLIAPGRPT